MTLLEKCNADVFKAIIDIKAEHPEIGEKMISILQSHEYWWQMTGDEMINFSAHLPYGKIWNNKIHTFSELFQSQPTTTMP